MRQCWSRLQSCDGRTVPKGSDSSGKKQRACFYSTCPQALQHPRAVKLRPAPSGSHHQYRQQRWEAHSAGTSNNKWQSQCEEIILRGTQVFNLILNGVNTIFLLSPRITSHSGLTQKISPFFQECGGTFSFPLEVTQRKSLM